MRQIPCQTFALIKNTLLTLLPPSPINCTYFTFYLSHSLVCLGKNPFQRNEEEKSSRSLTPFMVPLVCCCHLINLMFFPGFPLMVKPSLHSPCLSFLRCLQYSQILWAHHQVNIITSVSFANHVKLTMQRENQRIIFLGSVYLNLYL